MKRSREKRCNCRLWCLKLKSCFFPLIVDRNYPTTNLLNINDMKTTLLLLIASVLCLSHPVHAGEVKGMISFKNVPVTQILPIYKSLSGLELVIDSRVKRVSSLVTVAASNPLSKADAEKLIEKALLDQAAIVITRLDDKRASVTYNDALTTTR